VAFTDLYRRLESLTGTPAAAPERAPEPKLFASMLELRRFCAAEFERGNEHAGRVLVSAKEAERTGRAREFLRAVNLSQVNRCDVPGEILPAPARRRR
jgi:hypothetical protein